jgi:hypothetical protein
MRYGAEAQLLVVDSHGHGDSTSQALVHPTPSGRAAQPSTEDERTPARRCSKCDNSVPRADASQVPRRTASTPETSGLSRLGADRPTDLPSRSSGVPGRNQLATADDRLEGTVLAVAIVVVVVLNGLFAFAQEYRADRAAQRLRDLMPLRATVRRDGHLHEIDAAELVVGDELALDAGARICADGEVLTGAGLAVDESMLTGESVPVRPVAGQQVYAGTYVAEGEAAVLVTATGGHTKLAGIAALTQEAKPPRSPLATQLHKVVVMVAVMALVVGAAFFGVAVLLGLPLAEGFLFAIGVTVALVPEGWRSGTPYCRS